MTEFSRTVRLRPVALYDPVLWVYFMALRVAAALFLPLGKQRLSEGQTPGGRLESIHETVYPRGIVN